MVSCGHSYPGGNQRMVGKEEPRRTVVATRPERRPLLMRTWIAAVLIVGTTVGLAATVGATPSPPASPAVPPTSSTTTTEAGPTTTTTITGPPMMSPAQPVAAPIEPVHATPAQPTHDGKPQASAGQTEADAVTIADDGFGFPVETGPAEVRRLGGPYDTTDLAEVCVAKPWLCDDSYAR